MKYDCELNLEDRNSLSVLVERINPNSVILEFGPANGRMTKYMKEQLNCKVFAVEIDEQSARDATQYTEKIIVDSIENYTWKEEFKNIKFDYIIFADVLEHLYYPEKVLLNVKEFLKEDGSVLVSIPNIAHNSIIINLLKNEFNYNPTGLLDDTHIRFFTKKTFDELIEKTGYFISYETATFSAPENTEFQNTYEDTIPAIAEYLQILSFGEAYQLIYEIKKHRVEKISDFSEQYKINYKNFIQLYLDSGKGISEEKSIKFPVSYDTKIQEFVFDLREQTTLHAIRLDPLNDACVVTIEKVTLLTQTDEVEIQDYISSNACIIKENIYYFDHDDSQLYFHTLKSEDYAAAKELRVTLKYLYVGKDALNECYKITKEELACTKEELACTINSISWKITKPLRNFSKLFKK